MSEGTDSALLERFEQEVWSKVPHLEEGSETKVVNATPLVDMTADFKECARTVFKLDLDNADLKVFGKMDSTLLTGSIKVDQQPTSYMTPLLLESSRAIRQ